MCVNISHCGLPSRIHPRIIFIYVSRYIYVEPYLVTRWRWYKTPCSNGMKREMDLPTSPALRLQAAFSSSLLLSPNLANPLSRTFHPALSLLSRFQNMYSPIIFSLLLYHFVLLSYCNADDNNSTLTVTFSLSLPLPFPNVSYSCA